MNNLSTEVVNLLIDKNMTISFAESCTGGLAAARLIDVPAASKVIGASVITYSEEAKCKYLGVSPETILNYGVVSEETAYEMAIGVVKNNDASVGVGITGVAGPSGGTPELPVGTVCFGVSINGFVKTFTCHFDNMSRNEVREAAVDFVFEKLNILLKQ